MTTIEHRSAAALAILADAAGPLTGRIVRARLVGLGHDVGYAETATALTRLVRLGLLDTRADTLAGTRSRIFWPTTDGRLEAEILQSQRIEGV